MSNQSIDFVLLIPCYNNSEGLIASLKSVVYTEGKYEILIVDDGSSSPISEENLKMDFPAMIIRVIRLEFNQGIVNALNTGLIALNKRSDVKYIARLDAGDLCDERRFYKQVDFLDKYPEIALLATWARFQQADEKSGFDYITQTKHENILREMHYKCSFIHPSVMFRREILQTVGYYPTNYPHAEDYAFFWEILKRYKGAVLPEKLIKIAYSDSNVSGKNYKIQLEARKKIVKEFGNQSLQVITSLGLLNLKLVLPRQIINWLKLF